MCVQVMPGLLLCFVLHYDTYKRSQVQLAQHGIPMPANYVQRVSYFHCSLIGYFLGEQCCDRSSLYGACCWLSQPPFVLFGCPVHCPVLLTIMCTVHCCSPLHALSSVAHHHMHCPVLLTTMCTFQDFSSPCALSSVVHNHMHCYVLLTIMCIVQCCSPPCALSNVAHHLMHCPVLLITMSTVQCCSQPCALSCVTRLTCT